MFAAFLATLEAKTIVGTTSIQLKADDPASTKEATLQVCVAIPHMSSSYALPSH